MASQYIEVTENDHSVQKMKRFEKHICHSRGDVKLKFVLEQNTHLAAFILNKTNALYSSDYSCKL